MQHSDVQIEYPLLLYNFINTPSVKSYPEQRNKWVTAMRTAKWLAKNINNTQVCSAYLATDKPS